LSGNLGFGGTVDNSDVSTSVTGEDELKTHTVTANNLGISGGLKVFAAGIKSGSGGSKTIKLYFGSSNWTIHAPANNTNDWRLEADIWCIASNAQKISWISWDGVTIAQGYETASENTASDITLKLTGECADGADTITQTMWRVERVQY
jgi:hypothetical protein